MEEQLRSPWSALAFAYLPALVVAWIAWGEFSGRGNPVPDFFTQFRAAHDISHGIPPYPPADVATLLKVERTVYPPTLAFAALPFTVLPYTVAAALFLAALVAAGIALLRVLGVRDWRCAGLFFLWPSMATTLAVGAPGLLLALGAAVAWRWRHRARVVVPLLAVVIGAKLFLWPLVLWLLATGRRAVALATTAAAVTLTLGLWAAIGFSGLRAYPHLLHALSDAFAHASYSPAALELALGLSDGWRAATGVVLGVSAVSAIFLAARRPNGDQDAFVLAVCASLLLTPIVWLHYGVFLAIPIAAARRTLGAVWFAPLVLWVTPAYGSGGAIWRIALLWSVVAVAVAYAVGAPRREPATAAAAVPAAPPS